jgi:hypothetical protein
MIPPLQDPLPRTGDDTGFDVEYDYRTVIRPYQIPVCCTLDNFRRLRVRLSLNV